MTSTYNNGTYDIIYSEGATRITLDEVYLIHDQSKENRVERLTPEQRQELIEEIRNAKESFQDDLLFDALNLNE